MDFQANRVTWRGVTYDSQLEADWAATLWMWGIEHVYHPGRVALPSGAVWEPDFQVDAGARDLLLEVKGAHDDRLWKVVEARSAGFNVIVGRAGWIPGGSDVEVAGAVWEPAEEWMLLEDTARTMRFHWREDALVGHVMWSADFAVEHGEYGVRMFKAVGEDEAR